MDVVLIVLCGEVQIGREIRVPLPKCLVGRNPECHLRFLHPAVSRRHCVLYACEGRLFVRDLDSRNGTLLNGHLLWDDRELKTGDELQLGPLILEVRILLNVFAGERPAREEPGPPMGRSPATLPQLLLGAHKAPA